MRNTAAWLFLSTVLLLTGCGTGPSSADTGGKPTKRSTQGTSAPVGPSSAPSDQGGSGTAAAYRKWGLEPLPAAPPPPRTKPVATVPGAPVPVISDVPVTDKVVFVTFDDGAEKDPKFVEMMRELKVPFTMFLTDAIIRSDYAYFRPLQALGNSIENHTLTHPNLRTLSVTAQRHEMCGQQTRIATEYGRTPRLFRPPYGNWNEATRTAAGACGLRAVVLWREAMQIKGMRYQRGDKRLHPGDVILAHFRGPEELKGHSMTEMTANMLRQIQQQGFAVARLEDYV